MGSTRGRGMSSTGSIEWRKQPPILSTKETSSASGLQIRALVRTEKNKSALFVPQISSSILERFDSISNHEGHCGLM
jgi:hypothetical protein